MTNSLSRTTELLGIFALFAMRFTSVSMDGLSHI